VAEHLGYERGQAPPPGVGNQRNGISPTTVRTEVGDAALRVPRDRLGSFPRAALRARLFKVPSR
jgi:putative transposase